MPLTIYSFSGRPRGQYARRMTWFALFRSLLRLLHQHHRNRPWFDSDQMSAWHTYLRPPGTLNRAVISVQRLFRSTFCYVTSRSLSVCPAQLDSSGTSPNWWRRTNHREQPTYPSEKCYCRGSFGAWFWHSLNWIEAWLWEEKYTHQDFSRWVLALFDGFWLETTTWVNHLYIGVSKNRGTPKWMV